MGTGDASISQLKTATEVCAKMDSLNVDNFEVIGRCASIGVLINMNRINKSFHSGVKSILKSRVDDIYKYSECIATMFAFFGKKQRHQLEKNGLVESFRLFLCSTKIPTRFVLQMQEIAEAKLDDVNDIFLTLYTQKSGTIITLTIGSVIQSIYSSISISSYCRHFHFNLHIYVKENDKIYLPKCSDGVFYSWGYASRLAGVGSADSATTLTIDHVP